MSENVMLRRMQAEAQRKRKRRRKTIVAALLVILIAATAILVIYHFQNREEEVLERNLSSGFLPGSTAMDLSDLGEEMIRMQINSRPMFESGASEGTLYIGNPDTNDCDMEVEIVLDDTGETVYNSGLIPPGYYIDNDKLDVVLEDGTYPAIANITYYAESGAVQAKTGARLTITVGDINE